jgi:hypothetical protein
MMGFGQFGGVEMRQPGCGASSSHSAATWGARRARRANAAHLRVTTERYSATAPGRRRRGTFSMAFSID